VIEPEDRQILAFCKYPKRNMLIAERFLSGIVRIHGKYPLSTDGGTWYPQACRLLGRTSYSFLFGEKYNRKNNAIYRG
jgi:transposase-like protein